MESVGIDDDGRVMFWSSMECVLWWERGMLVNSSPKRTLCRWNSSSIKLESECSDLKGKMGWRRVSGSSVKRTWGRLNKYGVEGSSDNGLFENGREAIKVDELAELRECGLRLDAQMRMNLLRWVLDRFLAKIGISGINGGRNNGDWSEVKMLMEKNSENFGMEVRDGRAPVLDFVTSNFAHSTKIKANSPEFARFNSIFNAIVTPRVYQRSLLVSQRWFVINSIPPINASDNFSWSHVWFPAPDNLVFFSGSFVPIYLALDIKMEPNHFSQQLFYHHLSPPPLSSVFIHPFSF